MMFHHAVMIVPFLLVLVIPKSVGVRCCLFFFMIICLALRVVEYILFVVGCLMGGAYLVEQGEYMSKLTSPDIEEQKTYKETAGALTIYGGAYVLWGWIAIVCFIFWLTFHCLVLGVYWRFYAAAKKIW